MKDFFLSHAREDKEDFVIPLAKKLKERGMTFWLDEAEVEWGDNLFEKINEGLRNSHFVIVFLSLNFINKNWPMKELYAALNIEDKERKKKVLPLMLCDPKIILERCPLLAEKVYIRFEEGVDQIAIKCEEILKRKIMIVSNVDFPNEDKKEMLKKGYQKKENLVYKYYGNLEGNSLRLKTDLPEGTNVLVEISQVELEDMAVEIGAHAAVVQSIEEVMPDKRDELLQNKEVMEALKKFAIAMSGGRSSLRKYRKRIPTTILKEGVIELTNIQGVLSDSKVELFITII